MKIKSRYLEGTWLRKVDWEGGHRLPDRKLYVPWGLRNGRLHGLAVRMTGPMYLPERAWGYMVGPAQIFGYEHVGGVWERRGWHSKTHVARNVLNAEASYEEGGDVFRTRIEFGMRVTLLVRALNQAVRIDEDWFMNRIVTADPCEVTRTLMVLWADRADKLDKMVDDMGNILATHGYGLPEDLLGALHSTYYHGDHTIDHYEYHNPEL